MKKKGFTLVELLAVIVILGLVMTITSSLVINQKKKANQKEVESLYSTIKNLGADVYLSEKEDNSCYSDKWLKKNGYLKSEIKNPANSNSSCTAYLIINKKNENNMFEAYVECAGLNAIGTYPSVSCK